MPYFRTDLPLVVDSEFIFSNYNYHWSSKPIELKQGKSKWKLEQEDVTLQDFNPFLPVEISVGNKNAKFSINAYFEKALGDQCNASDYDDFSDNFTLNPSNASDREKNLLGIWYGCNSNNRITKPLLIVEGFDPFNARWLKCYTKDNGDPSVNENHLYYVANDNFLADSLRAHGYDIIILNFANGTGDLFTNSMIVVDAINWINQNKVEDNELVVIGPSMGGVLGRFALAFMEDQGLEHQCRLFLSFDAPQQGANVCLGMQHNINSALNAGNLLSFTLLEHLTNAKAGLLDAPATKQLVLYHHSATQTIQTNANPSPDHTSFYSLMESLNPPYGGYPVKCKKIAIANGSSNASLQLGVSNGENLLTWLTNTPPIPYLGSFRLYLRYNALPQHTLKSISQSYIAYSAWIFPFPPSPYIPFNISNIFVNNTDPMDNAPAGTQTFHSELYNSNLATLTPPINANYSKDAFIPTKSALDLKNTTDWRYNFFNNHISNINNYGAFVFLDDAVTPFDEVYVNLLNHPHVIGSITEDPISGIWANNEISPYHLKLQNDIVSYDTRYEAKRTIEVGRNVTSELQNGDFTIAPSINTDYYAGMSIEFMPGFDSNNGTLETFLENPTCNGKSLNINTNQLVEYNSNSANTSLNILDLLLEEENHFEVYPNPSSSNLFISVLDESIEEIEVFNLQGMIINKFEVENKGKLEVDVSHWSKGIYLFKAKTENDIKIKKVVVQ